LAASSRSLAPTDNPARECGSLRMPPEGGRLTVDRPRLKELTMAGKTPSETLEDKDHRPPTAECMRRGRKSQ